MGSDFKVLDGPGLYFAYDPVPRPTKGPSSEICIVLESFFVVPTAVEPVFRQNNITKSVSVDEIGDEVIIAKIISDGTLIPPEIIRSEFRELLNYVLKDAQALKKAYIPVNRGSFAITMQVQAFFSVDRFPDALKDDEEDDLDHK